MWRRRCLLPHGDHREIGILAYQSGCNLWNPQSPLFPSLWLASRCLKWKERSFVVNAWRGPVRAAIELSIALEKVSERPKFTCSFFLGNCHVRRARRYPTLCRCQVRPIGCSPWLCRPTLAVVSAHARPIRNSPLVLEQKGAASSRVQFAPAPVTHLSKNKGEETSHVPLVVG